MKRVLITGAASGLGAALAARYTARGDRVLATDVTADGDDRLDITSEADWAAALDRVRDQLGGLDILVNNAGIAAGGRIDRLSAEGWQRVLTVNVLGAVNGCRTFTPLFKQQGSGHIVNVASAAGLMHPPSMSSYNASKAAVVALSESLRHELGPWGVDVSVVCPSFFRTNLARSLSGDDPQMEEGAVRLINEARRGADEIAARVVHAVDARRYLILPDSEARMAYRVKRFARFLYDRKMFAVGAGIRREEQAEVSRG